MAEVVKEFSEPKGITRIFGVGDMGVEEGAYPGDMTIWDTGRPAGSDWMDIGPNGITFDTDAESLSYVRYQLWSGPPPAEEGWTHTWEGPLYLASGRIVAITASAPDEGGDGTEFVLPRQETTWHTRVLARYPDTDPRTGFPRPVGGPVLFKLQFWLDDR
ncbi:hypothetical protein [Sphaerisporangium sp. NPDC051011]|uniref:hypothetical protein n=1 Tax=Sphaerisporangium sp. NPDC051011 TaxID=3155792 RepID=UPI0033FC41B4